MIKLRKMKSVSASEIRDQIEAKGYAVADVRNRKNFLSICNDLGTITQTKEILLKPPEMVGKYAAYNHLPDEVPFHTDHPMVNVVGLFCERPDEIGGENLLMDSRNVLKELDAVQIAGLKNVWIRLPNNDDSLPILSEDDYRRPHIYWLPALALTGLSTRDDSLAPAVKKFHQVVSDRRNKKEYLSFDLDAGEAIWFDNFMMLHGRDRLHSASQRVQVRAYIQYRKAKKIK